MFIYTYITINEGNQFATIIKHINIIVLVTKSIIRVYTEVKLTQVPIEKYTA